jgi:hypothetical protein
LIKIKQRILLRTMGAHQTFQLQVQDQFLAGQSGVGFGRAKIPLPFVLIFVQI